MLDRVRIRTLRDAGHAVEEIADTVGVGKRSVQRILKEPAIYDPASAPTLASRGIGRPSTVEAFREPVEHILKEEPSVPTVEILSRVRGLGYPGGKSAVYELVKAIRPPKTESPEVRITTMVRTTGFVEYERIRYSMPPKTIGIPGTLFLYPDKVRIVTRDGTEAKHPRYPAVGNTSYRSEDRVAKLAAVHGQRARLYQKRQEILDLGPPAEALMTEWVHQLSGGLLPYVQPHVLVIDEVGYLTYSADAANVLFQVVDHRYLHKKPMLFTTNKPLTQWGRVRHDSDLAEAITDRVLERGRLIQLRGPSYRTRHLKDAEQGGGQACS